MTWVEEHCMIVTIISAKKWWGFLFQCFSNRSFYVVIDVGMFIEGGRLFVGGKTKIWQFRVLGNVRVQNQDLGKWRQYFYSICLEMIFARDSFYGKVFFIFLGQSCYGFESRHECLFMRMNGIFLFLFGLLRCCSARFFQRLSTFENKSILSFWSKKIFGML